MKKAIYTNLFIDNDWDKEKIVDEIFSLKVEGGKEILNSYLNLGTLWGNSSDFSLVEDFSDKDFLKYISEKMPVAQEVQLNNLEILRHEKLDDFLVVGVSFQEENLSKLLQISLRHSEDVFIKLNRKDFLVNFALANGLPFPQSEIVKLCSLELENLQLPFVLKILISAGGRGVLIIQEENKGLLDFLKRQVLDLNEQVEVIKQEFVPIRKHFYTIAQTDTNDVVGFEIQYDSSNNSKIHRRDNLSSSRIDIANKLSNELKKQGYCGFFGFDGFEDQRGLEFPIIDLNVRLDKSRIIYHIACKLELNQFFYEFRRERIFTKKQKNFKTFWLEREDSLNTISKKYNNNFEIIPVLFSNFFSNVEDSSTLEISFFAISKSGEIDSFELWLQEIYIWLGLNG